MYDRATLLIFLSIFLFFPNITNAETKIVINEFLAHPSSQSSEWVEFYNPDISDTASFWLDDDTSFTDDTGNSSKKSLVNLIASSSAYPYIELSSFLNNSSDDIVIFDTTGNIIDQYRYTQDPGLGIAIGRSPDGTGEFQILSSSTQGLSNSPPQPTPTLTPTQIPTPTNMPTITKTPTPTPTLPPANTHSPILIPTIKETTPKPTTKPQSRPALPTAILGLSTKSAAVSPAPKESTKSAQYQSRSDSKLAFWLASAGIAMVCISCAILFFLKIKKNQTARL